MAALPNIGGTDVQRHKLWPTPTAGVPCSNAAKVVRWWADGEFFGVLYFQ